jgi:glyoxylase-like metal-dependent hydrolase (beta-lactamase superfamily II)
VLARVADGVLVSESRFMQTNAVAVQGSAGVLLVDAGVVEDELVSIAGSLAELGQQVVAGFSTHPHWDHLLWHELLGTAPRYATARCAATVRARLPDAAAKARVTTMMPPDIVEHVPLDLLGLVTGLPAGTAEIPWDGPRVRIIEHGGHAAGHAALLIEERGMLVAGDMLSDILIPMLDMSGAVDPIGDYLAALELLEQVTGDIDVVIPGHGSVGRAGAATTRLDRDRAYVHVLRDGGEVDDARLGPSAYGKDFLPAVHERQQQHLARIAGGEGAPG